MVCMFRVMSSLNKGDKGRVGMSVEGKVIERDAKNPTIIKRCLIKNVALTMNPVNQDTFADIVKSMSTGEVEFASEGKPQEGVVKSDEPTFTPSQVLAIVEKALGVGAGNAQAPADMKGGDALGQEELDSKKKKVDPKKMKKRSKEMFKSEMLSLLDKLQALYPDNSRVEIWNAVRDRMETKFPELKTKEL